MKNSIAIALIALPVALAACVTGSSDPTDQDPTAPDSTDDTSTSPPPLPDDSAILGPHKALLDKVLNAADPQAAYNQLSSEEKAEFDSLTKPAGDPTVNTTVTGGAPAITPDVATAKFTGCWGMHATGGAKALAGNTLYTFWQDTGVCVKNGKVTSVSITNAHGETSTPGWRIAHAPTTSKLNAGWEGRGLAEYHFVLGAGPWDIQHPSDCLQLRLNADGKHHRVFYGCDLESP